MHNWAHFSWVKASRTFPTLSCFYEILMLENRNFFLSELQFIALSLQIFSDQFSSTFSWKNCFRTKLCDFHWEVEKFWSIRSAVCFLRSLESNAIIELSGLCSVRWRQLHANIPSHSLDTRSQRATMTMNWTIRTFDENRPRFSAVTMQSDTLGWFLTKSPFGWKGLVHCTTAVPISSARIRQSLRF